MLLTKYLKNLGLSFIFYSIIGFVFYINLLKNGNLSLISDINLLHFDAKLYQEIKNHGYHSEWLCAFFPAFPFLWDLLDLSPFSISILNSFLFLFSFSAISTSYSLNWKVHFFLLSIPSFMFMFVPYTESLFFTAGTILLIGLKEDKPIFIFLGLLFGSLIRPTTFVFIPSILISYLLTGTKISKSFTKSIVPIATLISGLFLTMLIHYYYSQKWFVFFEAQKMWKNYLHLPSLPLTSWGGDGSLRFDGSALVISILSGIYLIRLFIKRINYKISISSDIVFSLAYLSLTSLLILAYRDGNLYSLNRFIYATPFIIVGLNYFFNNYIFKWNHIWVILFTTEVFWLLFNSYNHIHNFLIFTCVSAYFIFMLLTKHSNKTVSSLSLLGLILINSIGLIKLAYRFLNNSWVG